MPSEQLCIVTEIKRLNPYAYSMRLEMEAPPSAPGQFLHIKCGHSRLLRRPISICDWDETQTQIVFEVRGAGTEWLSKRKVGDCLDVLGPLGHGFSMKTGGRYLLVGGGIGVPPLLGCARHTDCKCSVVLGFRTAERSMLFEDFRASCDEVITMSDDGSLGMQGFVDSGVQGILDRGKTFDAILACGPKPMLRSVARVAAERNIPCQVSMEERMGCGVGACLVCACAMQDGTQKHVCKDGPVFDSREVDWSV